MGFFDRFLAFAAPASSRSLNQYDDNERLKQDYGKIAQDATYQPNFMNYSDPAGARSSLSQFVSDEQTKQAAPILDKFKKQYFDQAGGDNRFFLYPEELKKAGVEIPENNANPKVREGLQAFAKQAQFEDNISTAMVNPNDVNALSRLAADPMAQANHNILATLQTSQDKANELARKEKKDGFTESQKMDAEAQQAEFDRLAAGIGGRYQDAQPKQFNEGADGALNQVPITAPQGKQPNVWNDGFNYVDGKGDVTPRRIMPFDEARRTLMELAAAYPKANTKEAFNGLRSQYKEAYSNADYVPSATNWMGEATSDKNQLQLAANSGDPVAKRIISEQDTRDLKQAQGKREIIVNNPLPAKVEVNALTPEEQTALGNAYAERRLDPYRVNNKNQKQLAQAAISHPGIDLNTIAAELGLARNTGVQMKAAVAEMLPGLVQKTVEAGKALNYSDVKFVGAVEKWKQGQLNDPKLTKYMTLRNDQLLTIGGVMRSNGMTDMAQKLEEEAMHPTLSPKALDSWMEGQLESIDPRLNFYRKATKGNTAIPRANYTPKAATGYGTSSGAAIAPAGTKVARKGGGFYTSDGKGGWN